MIRNVLLHWPSQIAAAYLLDLCIGDPERFFHPVRLMGKAILAAEPLLRRIFSNLYAAGWVLVLGLAGLIGLCVYATLHLADAASPWLGILVRIYFFYACLGTRSLGVEVRRVLKSLERGQIENARRWLSRIVGRDTDRLTQDEILRAAVETTAESTVDGIVSVLFYAFLGGPVLAMMFKMISTLDSMVGYKSERYAQFGWASAKLDDVANYLPARLGALLISFASFLSGKSASRAMAVVLADAGNQPSPNSGYPEAAFAGALNVKLGGENFYQGRRVVKASIGKSLEPLSLYKLHESLQLMYLTSALSLVVGLVAWSFASVCIQRVFF